MSLGRCGVKRSHVRPTWCSCVNPRPGAADDSTWLAPGDTSTVMLAWCVLD